MVEDDLRILAPLSETSAVVSSWAINPDSPSDIFTDLILAHTTNVEDLELTLEDSAVIGERIPWTVQFSKLSRMTVSYFDSALGFDLHMLELLLLKTPNLAELSCNMCRSFDADTVLANLIRLNFSYSSLSFEDMERVVQICPNLESFRYESGDDNGHYTNELTSRQICYALSAVKGSLRLLEIGVEDDSMDTEDATVIETLQDFVALEVLSIKITSIYGNPILDTADSGENRWVDMLPPSIQHINTGFEYLSETMPQYAYEHILRLAEATITRFKNLKIFSYPGFDTEEDANTIKAAFEKAGVICVTSSRWTKLLIE
jgi:hypothetical protein